MYHGRSRGYVIVGRWFESINSDNEAKGASRWNCISQNFSSVSIRVQE